MTKSLPDNFYAGEMFEPHERGQFTQGGKPKEGIICWQTAVPSYDLQCF